MLIETLDTGHYLITIDYYSKEAMEDTRPVWRVMCKRKESGRSEALCWLYSAVVAGAVADELSNHYM